MAGRKEVMEASVVRILVSVVTYRQHEQTRDFLQHAILRFNDEGLDYRIVVVDNYERYTGEEKAGIQDELNLLFPSLRVIDIQNGEGEKTAVKASDTIIYVFNNENQGYAKGNNRAFAIGEPLYKSDVFLVCGNDVEFLSNDLFRTLLQKIEENKDIGVIGPHIIGDTATWQGPFKYQSIYRRYIAFLFYPVIYVLFGKYFQSTLVSDVITGIVEGYVYRLMGCFLLFRSRVFDEVGGFDEDTFLFAEEQIISEKLMQRGYRNYYCGKVSIRHEPGNATGAFFRERYIEWTRFRNDMLYYRKYKNVSPFLVLLARLSYSVYLYVYKPLMAFLVALGGRIRKMNPAR